MFKKNLIFSLFIVCVLSLTGCSDKSDASSTSLIIEGSDSKVSDSAASSDKAGTSLTESSISDSTQESSEDISKPEESSSNAIPERDFDIGHIVDDTYQNSYLGIAYSLGPGWTFTPESEIEELNNVASLKVDKEYIEALQSLEAFYDMMAISSNQMDCVNITLQRAGDFELMISNDRYVSLLMKDYVVRNALAQMGFNDLKMTEGTINFLGSEKNCLCISGVVRGLIDAYEVVIPVKTTSHYGYVTICTWGENTCQDIADRFESFSE